MRGSIFPNLYRLAVGDWFGVSALLFPLQQYLRLGDYGIYRHGTFVRVGNIFEEFNKSAQSFQDESLADPLHDLLIHTANGHRSRFRSPEGLPLEQIHFAKGHGMVVQFRQRYSEQLRLSEALAALIRSLHRQDRWDPSYRLVWQRDVSQSWHAARTQGPGGTVVLYTDDSVPTLSIGSSPKLELVPTACLNINISAWHNNFPITPAVNFVRYCKRGTGFCWPERYDGIDVFMDLNAADPSFFLDNS